MPTLARKSKVFAVIPDRRVTAVHVLYRKGTSQPGRDQWDFELIHKYHPPITDPGDLEIDVLINLLASTGVTVRYYDPGEKRWLDFSEAEGLVPAPGNRDGSWGVPNLEDFEQDYLHFPG